MFTLKIKYIASLREYHINDRNEFGGLDIKQRFAFLHICPKGFFSNLEDLIYFSLIEIHGWGVKIDHID